MDNMERQDRRRALAQDILRLSRNTLLVNLRFLDLALSKFEYVEITPEMPLQGLGVDGSHIYYNPAFHERFVKTRKK